MNKGGSLPGMSLASRFIICLVAVNLVGMVAITVLTERYVRASLHGIADDNWTRATEQLGASMADAIQGKNGSAIADRYAHLVEEKTQPVGRVLALGKKGEVLASFELPGTDTAAIDAAVGQLVEGKPDAEVGLKLDGHYLVVSPTKDIYFGKQIGYLALAWRTDALDAAVGSVRTQLLLIQVAATLAIAAIIFLAMRRWMTKPLGAITRRIDALVAGDLQSPIDHQNRRDEMGVIARALETFRHTSIAKLQSDQQARQQQQLIDDERQTGERNRDSAARRQAVVVDQLGIGLAEIAKGNFLHELDGAFPEEYRKLARDYGEAVARLRETMGSIKQGSEGIRWNSEEIRQAASELSRRTEQQAANLEETVAALDEITAAVTHTAQSTSVARTVVSAAKNDAEMSGEVVHRTIGAMGQIEKSSTQISQIISVIDEIAFQTNLLALNAGVEAARAGDAGRGFAVVAMEVRTLAQRSAEAAKEIKELISASTIHVEQGVSMVDQTGKVLERIVAHVAEINKVVLDIASSTDEQAAGLQSINTSMNVMDQVTQQNATMAEEVTASSASLVKETDSLVDLIKHFQVGETATAARRPQNKVVASPPPRQRAAAAPRTATVGALALSPKATAVADDWEEF